MGLRWSDVDLGASRVAVVRQRVKGADGPAYGSPKNGKGRRLVSLDPDGLRAQRTPQRQAAEQLAAGAAYRDERLVFCREDGSPIDPDGLTQRFERHVRDPG